MADWRLQKQKIWISDFKGGSIGVNQTKRKNKRVSKNLDQSPVNCRQNGKMSNRCIQEEKEEEMGQKKY